MSFVSGASFVAISYLRREDALGTYFTICGNGDNFYGFCCFPEDQTLEGSVQNGENLLSRGEFFSFLHRPVSRKGGWGVLGEGGRGGGGKSGQNNLEIVISPVTPLSCNKNYHCDCYETVIN